MKWIGWKQVGPKWIGVGLPMMSCLWRRWRSCGGEFWMSLVLKWRKWPRVWNRVFRLVVKLTVNNTYYCLKQITWFILVNSRCCLLVVVLLVRSDGAERWKKGLRGMECGVWRSKPAWVSGVSEWRDWVARVSGESEWREGVVEVRVERDLKSGLTAPEPVYV